MGAADGDAAPKGLSHNTDLAALRRLIQRQQDPNDPSRPDAAQLRNLLILAVDATATPTVRTRASLSDPERGDRVDVDACRVNLWRATVDCEYQLTALRRIIEQLKDST